MPIITSLLDTDFYKFTTGQFVFCKHPDVLVKYALRNRTTSVRLVDIIPEEKLREELYYRATAEDGNELFLEGESRLWKKIQVLECRPQIKFSDFGTRRRFSKSWQEFVVWKLKEMLPL